MKTEMQVLEKLGEVIASSLTTVMEIEPAISVKQFDEMNVEIDFPDVDGMRRSTMLYIQPDYENLEPLGMGSDLATMRATVFILCKGAANSILVRRTFALYNALYLLVRGDPTLGGFIEDARITDMDYYPAVTASATVTAIETSVDLQWSKEF
ncbi:MAG: hypothetical protein EOM68_10180 [Spirochaetia bacterium]|nr:hypothetical protein [Spirochaetia bacterium]